MKAIVCVGNRYDPRDAAGPAVFDHLIARGAITGIDVIDGGIAGLDLLRLIDGAERVVFVDTVSGFGEPGEVLTIDPDEIRAGADATYDHGAGLAYLLHVAPLVCESRLPEFTVVGIEGDAGEHAIGEAADCAVAAARGIASAWQKVEPGPP